MKTIINETVNVLHLIHSNEYDKVNIFNVNRFCGGENQIELHPQQKIQFEKRVKKMMTILSEKGFDKNQYLSCVHLDGKIWAVDGQTRLEACKRLKIPFYYTLLPVVDFEKAYQLCFDLNNTGSKWTATDKVISNIFNPNFTVEQRAEQLKIVELANKYDLAVTVIKYIGHGQDSHKQKQMTDLSKVLATDTEDILKLAQTIAINSNVGIKLMKRDRFIRSVARMYRHDSFKASHIKKLIATHFDFTDLVNSDHYFLSKFELVLNKYKHINVIYFKKMCA